jgi:hypothetical protein
MFRLIDTPFKPNVEPDVPDEFKGAVGRFKKNERAIVKDWVLTPMTAYLVDHLTGALIPDCVWRFEHYKKSLQNFCTRCVSCPCDFDRRKHMNLAEHESILSGMKWTQAYNAESRSMVRSRYAEDFRFFGYEM